MLAFVSVLVLVIGAQAAPQFQEVQPLSGGVQPQNPDGAVTILSQTDSIGADGSFNNRYDPIV